jgi:hypothetical protein
MAIQTLKVKFKLTKTGRHKIERAVRLARDEVMVSFKRGINRYVKRHVIAFAPTEQQERYFISRGMTREFGMAGTAQGGRFYKRPHFKTVREAILREKPYGVRKAREIIYINFGNAEKMNPKIGFWWRTNIMIGQGDWREPVRWTVRRSDDSDAGDAWKSLIQAWEWGAQHRGGMAGMGFKVTRRPWDIEQGMIMLNIERGKAVKEIIKRIPGPGAYEKGFQMFRRGAQKGKDNLGRYLRLRIRKRIRSM